MKKTLLFMSAIIVGITACDKDRHTCIPDRFVNEVVLPTTPVKNQGHSTLCWIYAMLATIETDHIAAGDSINLSADYAARMWMARQARHHYLASDSRQISMRGMITMLPHVMEQYGMMTHDSYNNEIPVNYNVLARRMTSMADRQHSLQSLDKETERLLDEHIGCLPPAVHLYGATYTPVEFAHSLYSDNEYIAMTSFTHHPFGTRFILETADNVMADRFLNIPVDSLIYRIESSLRRGHPVCWEGDISEQGFSFSKGIAIIPDNNPCTQEQRQREYEQHLTTDDHCMALTGIARDRHGQRYFIAKNSWGTDNPYGGMMYLSENYVRMKTIAIMIRK